jgi:hypothetical protein
MWLGGVGVLVGLCLFFAWVVVFDVSQRLSGHTRPRSSGIVYAAVIFLILVVLTDRSLRAWRKARDPDPNRAVSDRTSRDR